MNNPPTLGGAGFLGLLRLEPVLLHLAVHHAVDLDAREGYLFVGRWDALELAAVGASEGNTRRDHVPTGEDVLHREPKVGKSLHEGRGEPRPGLQVKGAWERRGMGDVAWSQDVHFGLRRVGIVERFDPPSNDSLVVFF